MISLRTILHLVIIRPIIKLLFGVNIVGRENIANANKCIIFSNHNSHLDVFLLFMILPVRSIDKTHPIAALDYFKKPAWLYHAVNFLFQPIWIDRSHCDLSAIKEMQKRLGEGHNIIIFPEGTRGRAGQIQSFHEGIGLLEKKNPDSPVIPVYLEGPERAFPKQASFPLPLWNHITIGPPRYILGNSKDITITLHNHLMALAEEEQAYRQRRKSRSPSKPFIIAVIGIEDRKRSCRERV